MDVNVKSETSDLHINIEELENKEPVQDVEVVNNMGNKSNNTIKQYKVKKERIKKFTKTISKNDARTKRNRMQNPVEFESVTHVAKKIATASIDSVKQCESNTSSDVDESSTSTSMQNQNEAQKLLLAPLLTKILTIPLVRIDAKKLLEYSKNTTKLPVVGNTSQAETYIFEEDADTDIIKKEIKREPSVDLDPECLDSDDEPLRSVIENSESLNSEQSSNIEMENSEPRDQSLSVRVVSQGSWAPSLVSRQNRPPPGTNGINGTNRTNGTNGTNVTNGRPQLNRDRGSLTPAAEDPAVINYFVHFLRNVGAELRAMPLEDALELQAQMEQLIQRKRLCLLERRAEDLQQSVNRTGNQLGTSTVNWNSQNKNSSIIYMTYSNGDDNDDEE